MTHFTLTLLDTTGIQDYIFASNRLQENIGASELVYRATTLWAFDALEKVVKSSHNIKNPYSLEWDYQDAAIEKDGALKAEVVQAAGGNTLILFRSKDDAIAFVKTLTLRLLKDAPGLTVLAQHSDFDFATGNLFEARQALESAMRQHKQTWPGHAATLGLGVTAICESTGLPAVNSLAGNIKLAGEQKAEPLGLDGENNETLISSEVVAKRAWRSASNERLDKQLRNARDIYIFPYDLEKIGRDKGDESYLAVVHADGNRMGEQVAKIAQSATSTRDAISKLRKFSKQISRVSLAALERVVALTVQAAKNQAVPVVCETVKGEERKYLPLRPLVFGGDDLTFVCNGKIGLELAAFYMQAFREEAQKEGLDLHVSAGVSVVKLHYPFARAYALAENLIDSAKSLTRGENCSALDWHFAQSGLSGSLKHIREREYLAEDNSPLYRRPLTLEEWGKVEAVIHKFSDGWARNKVFGLREPLRKGGSAVKKYRQDFELPLLPEIAGREACKTGWKDGKCYYFDAIELLDHYVALKSGEGKK